MSLSYQSDLRTNRVWSVCSYTDVSHHSSFHMCRCQTCHSDHGAVTRLHHWPPVQLFNWQNYNESSRVHEKMLQKYCFTWVSPSLINMTDKRSGDGCCPLSITSTHSEVAAAQTQTPNDIYLPAGATEHLADGCSWLEARLRLCWHNHDSRLITVLRDPWIRLRL